MCDRVFDNFYRSIYADLKVDLEESTAIATKFRTLNPPPDKLFTLRAATFRIATEFLTADKDKNISLLRAISAIIHAIETTCMIPKEPKLSKESSLFDEGQVETMYRKIFSDLLVDQDEIKELTEFYESNHPPKDKLRWIRSSAFRIGSEFVSEDNVNNIALLRCINAIVHSFETNCLTPKVYKLDVKPFDIKGSTLSQAVQYLWDLDVNRATANRDYVIDVQGGKKPYQKHDSAPSPLFTRVDSRLFRRPTYRSFIALLDNYTAQTGVAEKVDAQERRENQNFIDAVMQTGPMQFCHSYCKIHGNKSDVPSDVGGFKKLLQRIWFDLYYRQRDGGRPDSSGFEHVFVGEIRDGKVSGFHNWIRFYLEEKKGNVDYRGYIKPRGRNNHTAKTNEDDNILTIQFTWNGYEKFVGTNFIGVSPEFELALYTMCFLAGEESNDVDIDTGSDNFQLDVKVHTLARDKIGTTYVEATAHYE